LVQRRSRVSVLVCLSGTSGVWGGKGLVIAVNAGRYKFHIP